MSPERGVNAVCSPCVGGGCGVLGFASRPRQGLCPPHSGPGCLDPHSSQLDAGASSRPPVGPARGQGAPFRQQAVKGPGRETPALRGGGLCRAPPGAPSTGRCARLKAHGVHSFKGLQTSPHRQQHCPLAWGRQTLWMSLSPGCWMTSGKLVSLKQQRQHEGRWGSAGCAGRTAGLRQGKASGPGSPAPRRSSRCSWRRSLGLNPALQTINFHTRTHRAASPLPAASAPGIAAF